MINWPSRYKILKNKNIFLFDDYCLLPIRFEDRYQIMKWRNEQLYHLRQNNKLTKSIQDNYFKNVLLNQFNQDEPNQLLFSLLRSNILIGYGGLVHINWINKSAEVSFVMKTKLEENHFESLWSIFTRLIEKVSFKELKLNKIFIYAFDLRPHLYPVLEKNGFIFEAKLRKHVKVGEIFEDVIIHSKFNEDK